MKKKPLITLILLVLGCAALALVLERSGAGANPQQTAPGLSFYTTGGATTPQMPFWKAVADGTLPELEHLDVHYWKNLDDLRGLMLTGKGDLWLGHVEGFAQAAMRGAPVRLLAVTGWRKFSILARDPQIRTVADLLHSPPGTRLAVTPPQSPAVSILRELEQYGLPRFEYIPHEPRQLTLEALQGGPDLILVPEPLTTVLLNKVPELHVVAQVEKLYGRFTGREPLLPIAGIAVNERLARERPQLVLKLQQALLRAGTELAGDPEAGIQTLPEEFGRFIGRDTIRDSLARDLILVRPAGECRELVIQYLALVLAPHGGADVGKLPDDFFWQ
ncbi:MAG: hypothetical protein KKE73_12385 [Proteobacteria bacterium]|nr:hypothetical protein [Pseudomonadota bacterium]